MVELAEGGWSGWIANGCKIQVDVEMVGGGREEKEMGCFGWVYWSWRDGKMVG